jgi:hypothetical protein
MLEETRPLRRTERRWKDDIGMDLREYEMVRVGVMWLTCEHCDETSISLKIWKIVE